MGALFTAARDSPKLHSAAGFPPRARSFLDHTNQTAV